MSTITFDEKNSDAEEDELWLQYTRSRESLFLLGLEKCTFIQHKEHVLHFVQTDEVKDTGSKIAATSGERLSYLGSYFYSPLKTQIWVTSTSFHYILLRLAYQAFFKVVPHSYIILFLSRYSPREHLYASKMVPYCYEAFFPAVGHRWLDKKKKLETSQLGLNIAIILCGVVELAYHCDQLTFLFDFAVNGLINTAPWHKCSETFYNFSGKMVQCLTQADFYELTTQNSTQFDGQFYDLNGTLFQSAEMIFFRLRWTLYASNENRGLTIFYCMHWVGALILCNQIFRKAIWRVLEVSFVIICAILLITILLIELLDGLYDLSNKPVKTTFEPVFSSLDFKVWSQSPVAPPILHVLYSQSKSMVQPGRDSSILTVFSCLYYVLHLYAYEKLQMYCDSEAGIFVTYDERGSYPLYYLWPIWFKIFTIGRMYTKTFYLTLFILEYVTFAITQQCLVEAISSEWRAVSKWVVSALVTVSGLIFSCILTYENRFYFYIGSKSFVTIMEVVMFGYLYPMDRLIEDIRFFYYGDHMAKMRKFTLNMLIYNTLFEVVTSQRAFVREFHLFNNVSKYSSILLYMCLYIFIFCTVVFLLLTKFLKKKRLSSLTYPVATWGPDEHIVRQFRKLFDSRYFIDSLSTRFVGRFMLKRAEPPCYRLDLQYDEQI